MHSPLENAGRKNGSALSQRSDKTPGRESHAAQCSTPTVHVGTLLNSIA